METGKYYHIYNRANGFENLFVNEGNYDFFLSKIDLYLSPILNVYAYCLMPNHFHLLVKIKSEEGLKQLINNEDQGSSRFQTWEMFIQYFISKQFANLFSSYTQSFNKQQNRTGSLFQKGFKHKEIVSEEYLKELILYIHCNPVHHGFVEDFSQWENSSYSKFLDLASQTAVEKEVINYFGDMVNFQACHQDKNEFNLIKNLVIE